MQKEVDMVFMLVFIQMINTIGIEKRTSPFDSVNDVSFFEQQFGEVCSVLARNTRNQRNFCHWFCFVQN
jgi:hypothetical protein